MVAGTQCPGVWWPGKDAVKERDNSVSIYLAFVCEQTEDISPKKAADVLPLLHTSVVITLTLRGSGIVPKCFALAQLFPPLEQAGVLLLTSA